ncbi:MAG TPA: helix-turn-helix domain-containing protein [Stellaceae bacterium]|nr:helix-turn-helix domain-containing protein [Stellaceae bacterium]
MTLETAPMRRGTGSLSKALRLLSEIGSAEPAALRLTELVSRTNIESSTAFRMLACLVEEDFLQKVDGKRYRLGQRVFELGLVAGQHFQHYAAARSTLSRLASQLDAPVTLDMRSGAETVHVGREGPEALVGPDGAIGTRLPIGVGAGGVALLAAMPPNEADRLISGNERRYRSYGRDTSRVLRLHVHRARLDGYACVVRSDMGSIGIVIPGGAEAPRFALSTSRDAARLRGGMDFVTDIRAAAADIAAALAAARVGASTSTMREEERFTP